MAATGGKTRGVYNIVKKGKKLVITNDGLYDVNSDGPIDEWEYQEQNSDEKNTNV